MGVSDGLERWFYWLLFPSKTSAVVSYNLMLVEIDYDKPRKGVKTSREASFCSFCSTVYGKAVEIQTEGLEHIEHRYHSKEIFCFFLFNPIKAKCKTFSN